MSCIGIGGSFIALVFVLALLKPVYSSMLEDIFLKIGGNRNIWSKLINSIYTLCTYRRGQVSQVGQEFPQIRPYHLSGVHYNGALYLVHDLLDPGGRQKDPGLRAFNP